MQVEQYEINGFVIDQNKDFDPKQYFINKTL